VAIATCISISQVNFYGVCTSADGELQLVFELCAKGSMRSLLHSPAELPWAQRLHFAIGIAKGMKYLHGLDLVHRDLKSDNVLVSHSGAEEHGAEEHGAGRGTLHAKVAPPVRTPNCMPMHVHASLLPAQLYFPEFRHRLLFVLMCGAVHTHFSFRSPILARAR